MKIFHNYHRKNSIKLHYTVKHFQFRECSENIRVVHISLLSDFLTHPLPSVLSFTVLKLKMTLAQLFRSPSIPLIDCVICERPHSLNLNPYIMTTENREHSLALVIVDRGTISQTSYSQLSAGYHLELLKQCLISVINLTTLFNSHSYFIVTKLCLQIEPEGKF